MINLNGNFEKNQTKTNHPTAKQARNSVCACEMFRQLTTNYGLLTFNFYFSMSPRSTENAWTEPLWCRGAAGMSLQRVVEGDAALSLLVSHSMTLPLSEHRILCKKGQTATQTQILHNHTCISQVQ